MTSSSTVGTGRRYRLPDWLGGHEVTIESVAPDEDRLVRTVKPVVDGQLGWLRIAEDCLTPVGLDMAEPDDGAVVRVEPVDESADGYRFVAERDDESASEAGSTKARRWFTTKVAGNRHIATWDELCALPDVSITVLVPRDDDLRARLEMVRDQADEKARNLTDRNQAGVAHGYYRDVFNELLEEPGFPINGRTQPDQEG